MDIEKEFDDLIVCYGSELTKSWDKTIYSARRDVLCLESVSEQKEMYVMIDSIDTGFWDAIDILKKEVTNDLISTYHSYLEEINTLSDEDLIERINEDERVYHNLFNPSEFIVNYYKMRYKL